MRTITIKGIPDQLYERLKQRAATNRRSVNSEVIVYIERAVGQAIADPHAQLVAIDALRKRLNVPRLTDTFLQEAKQAGRP